MESYILPELQKSTSVQCTLNQKENLQCHPHSHKTKVGSLPQLPHTPLKGGLSLIKKNSCIDRCPEHPQSATSQRTLYQKVLSLIEEMISDREKFQLLMSALNSMEHSIKNVKKSKASIDHKTTLHRSAKQKFSQGSIEAQSPRKMTHSLGLSASEESALKGSKGGEICAYLAESIEIQYPYDSVTGIDKVSLVESEEMMVSHFSGAKSIEEEMLESLHFPQLPEMYRKISLLLAEEQREGSELGSSNASNPPTFPHLPLAMPLVQALFADASPLLVNLALSLLFKYLLRTQSSLTDQNSACLLGVSALVAYKIFYDQTLEGILDYFGKVLRVGAEEAAKLQRWFLGELNYQVLVSNRQYTEIMIKLMGDS